jgi:hypothetical protein
MSLYGNFTLAAALGLQVDCRNDAGGDGGAGDGSPDMGAAGGADASPDDSAQQTSETDVNADAAAQGAAADDDDDDPDLKDDAHRDKHYANDPDFQRLKNKARTLQRKLAKYRPIVEKVRAFGVADNLDDVVRRAQRFDEVQPLLRRATSGGESSRAERQPQEYKPPSFDRSSVPFDENDPGGRFMIDFAERQHNAYHNLVGVVHQMAREINTLREGHQGEQRTKEVTTWRTELETASRQLPEKVNGIPLRTLFQDAVIGAFHQAKVTGRRVNPQQVIAHYLKEFKGQKTNPAAATAAAQQRMAENNRALPGRQAFAGGTPAEARNRSQERVKDVSRRLLGGRRW